MRYLVVGAGVLIFGLLFFADKTQLETKSKPAVADNRGSNKEMSASHDLPPLSADAATDTWIEKSKSASGKDKLVALDSVIARLSARNRYDFAVSYAEEKLKIENSASNQLLAGELASKALKTDAVAEDSILYESFSKKSIAYLEGVVAKDSTNERALLALGTAYVESKNPQNSMQGILTIRKVTELNPNNAEAQYQLGLRSIQTGQWDKAEARLEKVAQLQPQNLEAKFALANAKQQLGKVADAKKLAEEVLNQSKDPQLKASVQKFLSTL